MASKSKLTKEVVAQEARFILENLVGVGKYGQEAQLEDLTRMCESSLSLRFQDYLDFLERFGYLSFNRNTHQVSISSDGQRVLTGDKVADLVIDVVHHFRPILTRSRPREDPATGLQDKGGTPARPPMVPSARRSSAKDRLVDERYQKLRRIGCGGVGTVFLARQILLVREVALKEVRDLFQLFNEAQRREISRRFDEEVARAAKLSHPNIVMILDANTVREHPYVVSEFLPGGNLQRVLKKAERIPPDMAVKIFLQVLHALRHAHGRGVIHRGLKPENILFDATGNIKITDFCMARVTERDREVIQHLYVGTGSVGYMAPELFTDPTDVGPSSDLYALGIVLYEMLARKLPGRRSHMPTELHSELPKVIDDIFDKLTQDDRADRFASAEEVLEQFHSDSASKDFLDSRAAVLFLDNPLDKLHLPEEEAEEEEEEEQATEGGQNAEPEDETRLAEGEPTPAPVPAPMTETTRAPIPLDLVGAVVDSETEGLSLDEPSPLDSTLSAIDLDASILEIEEESGEVRQKRRSPVSRPYSFRQRQKDRDK